MRFLHLFNFAFLVLILSCQSTESLRPPVFDKSFSVLEKKLFLETVIANWDATSDEISVRNPASKINWQDDLHRACMQQDNLCEFNVKTSKKRDSFNRKNISEISQNLEKENFDLIAIYNIELGLKFFPRFKKNKLIGFADILLRDKECKTTDFKHALASTLEDDLPNFDVKSVVQSLYESNSECPISRTVALSSYRAAMLRLIDQDCHKATPLLEKVTSSTEDYLKPRSLYWTWRCQGESSEIKAAADAQLPYFSYHRLLMDESSSSALAGVLKENETPVLVETQKNSEINAIARLAERLIANQMLPAARTILEKIRVDRIQETEPEFQVYWARLLHLTHAGIKKFQILASLINTYPQFRTKTVQNMLFPTSFFDDVEARSKKLDPWLVQSLIRQESAFDPRARSRVGATGLMQLMPATARRISKVHGQLRDPAYNIHTGIRFLEKLVSRFDGQVHLALAAYNAGPGKVEEWQRRYPTLDPILFVDAIPYRETREYVAFIFRNYYWYRSLNIIPSTEPETTPDITSVEPKTPLARMALQIDFN
jgi:hypothetical protein